MVSSSLSLIIARLGRLRAGLVVSCLFLLAGLMHLDGRDLAVPADVAPAHQSMVDESGAGPGTKGVEVLRVDLRKLAIDACEGGDCTVSVQACARAPHAPACPERRPDLSRSQVEHRPLLRPPALLV